MFNDNGDGTLTMVGHVDKDTPHVTACVVSQSPMLRDENPPARPHPLGDTLAERENPQVGRFEVSTNAVSYSEPPQEERKSTKHPNDSTNARLPKADDATLISPVWQPQHPKAKSKDTLEALESTIATSDTWKVLESLIATLDGRKGWLLAYRNTSDFERRALTQLISLPPKNTIEGEWLSGIKKSNQQSFKGLICILIAIVGVRGPCQACKSRTPEKTQHCAALPLQAEKMHELQQLVGKRCADCYHFPTTKDCEFPSLRALTAIKQTPVPIPQLSGQSATVQTRHFPERVSVLPVPPVRAASSNTTVHIQPRRPISNTPIPLPTLPSVLTMPLPAAARHQAAFERGRPMHTDAAPSTGKHATMPATTDVNSTTRARRSKRIPSLCLTGASDASSASDESSTNQSSAMPTFTAPHLSSTSIVGKALGLLTEVSQLPNEEQSGVYTKIVEMIEVIRRPTLNHGIGLFDQISNPVAEKWETAPGRLAIPVPGVGRESQIAFSTSYLRREVIDVQLATQISRGQRILNRQIPALHQVMVERFDARWDCTLTVLEGFVNVKTDQMEAKIGQGGVFVVRQCTNCSITNVTHRDCSVQIRWVDT